MQTRRSRSVSTIDNTPESFLAFDGNESVHGLYDLLLNYRCVRTFFEKEVNILILLTNFSDIYIYIT